MNATLNTLRLALTVLLVLSAAASSASAVAADQLPEYGFRGLKRVELVYVNDTKAAAAPSEKPADDLASRDLAKGPDCVAIGKTLSNAGLKIVEQCKDDDFACGQLYLTVENLSNSRITDRIYVATVLLSQPVTLSRDKKIKLAIPSTWSAHRVMLVASDQSATDATCADLRSLGTWFGSTWKLANK
jgi:hypothetical protein